MLRLSVLSTYFSCARATIFCAALALSLLTPYRLHAEVKLKQIATGFSSPVDLVNAGDSRLFVVQKNGIIRIIQRGSTTYSTFLDLSGTSGPVLSTGGEQGLLGLAFAPDYATSGRFYVYYTRKPDGAINISRFTVSAADANVANTSETVILTIPHPSRTNHNGGGLRFGPDGMLYIAVGDGGGGGDPDCNAQARNNFLGKLLRIDVSGAGTYTVPANNPLGLDSNPSPILAIGLRNPWRISFDRVNGDLYIGDVGQGDREEVNLLPAYNPSSAPTSPLNYGWPRREGLVSYPTGCTNATGLTSWIEPIFDYDHSNGDLSITGGYRYRGTRVPELTTGQQYLYADFVSGRIWIATKAANGSWSSSLFTDASFNVSTFGEGSDGELYVVAFGGEIYRFTSTLGPSLDIDLNGSFDAATDGLLLLRYLFGLRDAALVANAVGSGATRSSAQDIATYLNANIAQFDVDGAANASSLGDGLIALRYLLNLPNAAMVQGSGATANPALIRARLDDLKP
jgi:glucose/arabinose dehydrogenase